MVELIENPRRSWQIPSIFSPKNLFCELHKYFKKSPTMKMYSKTSIGKLYTKIDTYLSERKFRPDNAYRYVDRMVRQYVPDVHVIEEQSSSFNVGVEASVLDSLTFNPSHINTEHIMTDAAKRPPRVHAYLSRYQPRNVVRRENRNKLKIKLLKKCVEKQKKELNKFDRLVKKKNQAAKKLKELHAATVLKKKFWKKIFKKVKRFLRERYRNYKRRLILY